LSPVRPQAERGIVLVDRARRSGLGHRPRRHVAPGASVGSRTGLGASVSVAPARWPKSVARQARSCSACWGRRSARVFVIGVGRGHRGCSRHWVASACPFRIAGGESRHQRRGGPRARLPEDAPRTHGRADAAAPDRAGPTKVPLPSLSRRLIRGGVRSLFAFSAFETPFFALLLHGSFQPHARFPPVRFSRRSASPRFGRPAIHPCRVGWGWRQTLRAGLFLQRRPAWSLLAVDGRWLPLGARPPGLWWYGPRFHHATSRPAVADRTEPPSAAACRLRPASRAAGSLARAWVRRPRSATRGTPSLRRARYRASVAIAFSLLCRAASGPGAGRCRGRWLPRSLTGRLGAEPCRNGLGAMAAYCFRSYHR